MLYYITAYSPGFYFICCLCILYRGSPNKEENCLLDVAVRGGNGLVKLTHCQRNIQSTHLHKVNTQGQFSAEGVLALNGHFFLVPVWSSKKFLPVSTLTHEYDRNSKGAHLKCAFSHSGLSTDVHSQQTPSYNIIVQCYWQLG